MTKISSKSAYPKKKPITADYFVGTDSESFGKTVNFGFEEVAGLVNELNGTPILNYVFTTSPYVDTEVLVEGRFLSFETELETPLLTKLYVNKFNNSGGNLDELYLFLKTNATDFYLKLRNSKDQNNTVYFDISSIESFQDYFIFNISVFKENEFLPLLENLNVYFFDFELKSTASGTSDPLKLDKSTYTGNAKNLDDRIIELENANFPDAVLKYGKVVITGNTATIDAADFNWRLNQIEFLSPNVYSTIIDEATAGFYRSDLIEGDNTGNYHLKKGTENAFAAPEPEVTDGRIRLSVIPIFGATIGSPVLLPNYDDKFLKRYKTTYKTSQPIFNLEPAQDDYNVIFKNTSNSEIRIWENLQLGKYIKNGAIYPFKSMGAGIVTVVAMNGSVIINAPNGLVLNKNQQCYLIKDDSNEWTLINPKTLQNVDNTSDADKPVSTLQASADADVLSSANLYTDGKVASLYKIKGSVANYSALPSTGQVVGDVWNLTDTGANHVWTGTVWDELGTTVDISGKEDASNKTSTLTASAVLYPNNNAVITGLATKQNTISGTANVIPKYGTGGLVGSQLFDDGTNVGIGTVSPIGILDVKGATASVFTRTSTTPLTGLNSSFQLGTGGTHIGSNGVGASILFFGNNTSSIKTFTSRISGYIENATSGQESGGLIFSTRSNSSDITASIEKMRITSTGNLLINTTTDNGTDKLQVNGSILGTALKLSTLPATSASTYDILTRNSTSGVVEKLASTLFSKELGFACSDESSAITTGLKVSYRMPYAMTLSSVRISLTTAATIGSFIVDVKQNGTSIFSTLVSIDASELTSTTAATPAVISTTALTDDSLITIHVTQIGSGDAGKGLKLLMIGNKS
jgi:hypothetical protein